MDNKALALGWIAVSVLWVLYWIAMTASLGVEAIGELVVSAGHPLLVGALCVSLPIGLFFIGMTAAWLRRIFSGGKA